MSIVENADELEAKRIAQLEAKVAGNVRKKELTEEAIAAKKACRQADVLIRCCSSV